jgi:hypothetical protein
VNDGELSTARGLDVAVDLPTCGFDAIDLDGLATDANKGGEVARGAASEGTLSPAGAHRESLGLTESKQRCLQPSGSRAERRVSEQRVVKSEERHRLELSPFTAPPTYQL